MSRNKINHLLVLLSKYIFEHLYSHETYYKHYDNNYYHDSLTEGDIVIPIY